MLLQKKGLPIESNTINNNIDDGKGNIYVVCNLRNNIVYIYNIWMSILVYVIKDQIWSSEQTEQTTYVQNAENDSYAFGE